MQVCVPSNWEDVTVQVFAEQENPCGTGQGWQIRKQVQCDCREDYVHIMLDA